MSYATVQSCTLSGVDAVPVTVEVHTSGGLPSVNLVGLPQSAVRESKDRVRAAIQNAGFEFPAIRITINLAPADLPKQLTQPQLVFQPSGIDGATSRRLEQHT